MWQPAMIADDWLALVFAPLIRCMLWATFSAVLSMALYARLSPQAKLQGLKLKQQESRRRLLHYDGEMSGMLALIQQDLAISFKQLALVSPPVMLSVLPVIYVMLALPEHYPPSLTSAGPQWMQGFEFWYLLTLFAMSLFIKIRFKII